MTAAAFALRPGDVFHQRYTVVRCIATGGMGSVYEVFHNTTRRKCALKVMLPSLVADPELRARFQAEAAIAAQIGSEFIVDVLDAGVDPATGTPFIVMELLVGEELCDRLVRLGPMPPAEAVELLRQAALALDRTHAAGIIHRDLKPENFFIAMREDGSARMKILDFGIAKVVAESAYGSRQTGTMGTPLYMPPEQVDGTGSIHFQADLYAFAQVAYAMLVGEAYFDEDLRAAGGVFGLLSRVMAGPREPMSERARRRRNVVLPAAVDAWFFKATARRPEDRFQRASAQVAALAEALGVQAPARASFGSLPPDLPRVAAAVTAGPVAGGPQLTGVPVSTDAAGRRRAAGRRWPLPVASGALAVSVAVLVWLALDLRSSGARPSGSQAAVPAASVSAAASVEAPASASAEAPASASAEAPASASAEAPASASAAVSEAPAPSAALSTSTSTSAAATPAPAAPRPAPRPAAKAPARPKKPKSVLDVGP